MIILRLDFGLSFATAEALEDRVRELIDVEREPRAVVLDFAGVDFIDSQGSEKLREIHRLTDASGAVLRVARMKPHIRAVARCRRRARRDRLRPPPWQRRRGGRGAAERGPNRRAEPEAVDDQAVTKTAVAHDQRVAAELRQHRAHDAGTGENDLGPIRLEADDGSPLVGRPSSVELDLPVDLGSIEPGALDDVRVVRPRVRA